MTIPFLLQKCKRPILQVLFAFLVALSILFWQIRDRWHEAPYADEVTYMSVALPLFDTGIYQDGNFRTVTGHEGPNGEGMFFAPLYPAFLEVLMHMDSGFAETVRCSVKHAKPVVIAEKCAPLHLETLVTVQILLMALASVMVWICAYLLTWHMGAAWLAMLFVFPCKDYAELASVSMNESVLLPLFTFSMLASLLAFRHRSILWSVTAGVAFGALCLTKPSFVYMLMCAVPFIAVIAAWQMYKRQGSRALLLVLLFGVVCVATISPWVIRNGTKIGIWDISYGLAPFTFSQRVAYNEMTWTEWAASFIYGLPSFGDNLAEDFLPESSYKRFSYDDLDGFYQHGNRVLRPETMEKAGSYDAHFGYLLDNYLFAAPFKHVMVTFSLVWRGMWVGGKPGLVAIPALVIFLLVALRRKNYEFSLFAVVPIFMLGFHAFTSVNVARYNLILLPALGIAFAWAVIWGYRKWKKSPEPLPGLNPMLKEIE